MKKIFAMLVGLIFSGFVAAAVDVNKADKAALDEIKGIGPATADKILAERKKGSFKDWNDLIERVNGIGDKNSVKLSAAGLTVDGKSYKGVAPKAAKADAKKDDKPVADAGKKEKAKSDEGKKESPKSDAKKDAKDDKPKAADKKEAKADKAEAKKEAKEDKPKASDKKEDEKKSK